MNDENESGQRTCPTIAKATGTKREPGEKFKSINGTANCQAFDPSYRQSLTFVCVGRGKKR